MVTGKHLHFSQLDKLVPDGPDELFNLKITSEELEKASMITLEKANLSLVILKDRLDLKRRSPFQQEADPLLRILRQSFENAVIKLASSGNWIEPDYANRFKLPKEFLQEAWKMVDIEKVKIQLKARLEEEMVDKIIHSMAAEITTDIKSILSNNDRRESLRAVVRENFDRLTKIS